MIAEAIYRGLNPENVRLQHMVIYLHNMEDLLEREKDLFVWAASDIFG